MGHRAFFAQRKRLLSPLGVIIVVCAVGCSASGSRLPNEALPIGKASIFALSRVSGMRYSGDDDKQAARLSIQNTPGVFVTILTPCGEGHAIHAQITQDALMLNDFVASFDASGCTPDQFAVANTMSGVLSSNPSYEYNGERLRLTGNGTTMTLKLLEHVDLTK